MAVIGRLDGESARWYVDPTDPEIRYESVTTILSRAESLPWLLPWAARIAGEYVAANLDELVDVHARDGAGAVVSLVAEQTRLRRELKADIGSHCHDVLEALMLDAPIPEVPLHLVDVEVDGERVDHEELSDGLLAFLSDFDVTPVLAEATVVSETFGYAGTCDLVGDLGRPPLPHLRRLLVDLKTGLLKEHARAQLAAYRRASTVLLDSLGNRAPMPAVDGAAVLHVRRTYARGYKLVPAWRDTGEEEAAFRWFLACQTVLRHQEAQLRVPRGAWYPPLPDGSQPPPLLEDVEHTGWRARNLLIAAGITRLDELARFTATELRGLRGIGPAAVEVCAAVLAGHGLALAADPEPATSSTTSSTSSTTKRTRTSTRSPR